MSFKKVLEKFDPSLTKHKIDQVSDEEIEVLLFKEKFSLDDLIPLLSPAAEKNLSKLSIKAKNKTLQHFGRTIKLYAPLYLSSYCRNSCVYCNFNKKNKTARRRLSLKEAQKEAQILFDYGFRHILLVAGEDPDFINREYLAELIKNLKTKFSGVSVEIAPLEAQEYLQLENLGLDGLTIYQETYDHKVYREVHAGGSKSDFWWRLATPERGGQAKLRELGIGFLLGLADWRVEGFYLGMHAAYLMKNFWQSQISISFPRIRNIEASFRPPQRVSDKNLLQLITALRLVFPHVDMTLSTRECPALRDDLIGVGITRMSAGSKTSPGGYANAGQNESKQFSLEDHRSPLEVSQSISSAGFDPVFKDWERLFDREKL
ncbi:MAG: 2-iminoacetate synthase ThiH [Candidatus Margulisbacteria bacterium]|nr:2-iminoacetate synthase ThiH [Candidatus Margulisiibacteriota bacterium]MBU1022362.1 2-iminoacetate synthase ThiH [Candidatus Margulisiibacteriota bacterium]MBU1729086.1 2-iminoacetate synthase ThiH [Candidatus Margulisiibacteriota bacterium]MBU1954493.1 2-iminoacetate synthase ThiH [Candidatus Margulisiibacteriota bacterium]